MSDRPPIPLDPIQISLGSPEFTAISGWPFEDPFVSRLLRDDIPQRMQFAEDGEAWIWIYRDPAQQLVGFGTLVICDDYSDYTDGEPHPYIPLLAVNPTIKSLGYGTSIVRHLIDQAALACLSGGCHDLLFLDVYTTSVKAIELYRKCGFEEVGDTPTPDPQEGGKTYLVMAKRVSIAPA